MLVKLWRLAKKEARDAGCKIPILIMQRARRSSLITMTGDEFKVWKKLKGNSPIPSHIIVNRKGLAPIVIMNLAQFFNWTENVVIDRFKNAEKN